MLDHLQKAKDYINPDKWDALDHFSPEIFSGKSIAHSQIAIAEILKEGLAEIADQLDIRNRCEFGTDQVNHFRSQIKHENLDPPAD